MNTVRAAPIPGGPTSGDGAMRAATEARQSACIDRFRMHSKSLKDRGRNTIRFVEPDAVPRIWDEFEAARRHAGRSGPAFFDRREDILLAPNERCRNVELGPPLVKQ